MLSPQRSKRVKENTPPRCAVLQSSSASICPPPQGCGGGGWGTIETEQASSTTRNHSNQQHVPRQTIIIPDTPSPAVSIITISSDTDEEDDRKHNHGSVLSFGRNWIIASIVLYFLLQVLLLKIDRSCVCWVQSYIFDYRHHRIPQIVAFLEESPKKAISRNCHMNLIWLRGHNAATFFSGFLFSYGSSLMSWI